VPIECGQGRTVGETAASGPGAAIYQLGNRQPTGSYLGLNGGATALVRSAAAHCVRRAANDYLYGALMGLSIVIMLLIPVFKKRLLTEYIAKK